MVLRVHPLPAARSSPPTSNGPPIEFVPYPVSSITPSSPRSKRPRDEPREPRVLIPKRPIPDPLRPPVRASGWELRCPACGAVVPPDMKDASACPNCSFTPAIPDDPPSVLPRRDPNSDDDDYGANPSQRHVSFALPATTAQQATSRTSTTSTSKQPKLEFRALL